MFGRRPGSEDSSPHKSCDALWGILFAIMVRAAGDGARFQFASDRSLLIYFDQLEKEVQAPDRMADKVHDMLSGQAGATGTGEAGGTSAAGPLQGQITLQTNQKGTKLRRLTHLLRAAGRGARPPAE